MWICVEPASTMDAKDLRTEAALGERSNDGNTKYSQSGGGALPCHRNKNYQDIGSLGKVDVPTARPCAVIGPDRVVPPPVSTDAYLKKGPLEPWLCPDNTYRRPPDYPHKVIDYQHPTRNISPRQTFQENMQRIMVPPSYNSLKLKEDHNFSDANISQIRNNKLNVPTDSNPKYCDVPYTINPMTNEQKNVRNSDIAVSNMNTVLSRSAPHGWPPASASIRPTKPFSQEVYQFPDYPSCAGPRPMLMARPHRTVHEEPGPVYPDAYYHDGSIRFKPYPTVKERYPQSRYDYVNYSANPFHPPFPPHKYDMQKPSHPYPGYTQVPLKYLDGRMPEPIMNGYQRPMNQQPNFNNLSFRNQVIHPTYAPMSGNCLQANKFYPYPPDNSKSVSSNKLPYDINSKIYAEYENNRNKSYPMAEGFYVNEIPKPHPMKGPILPPSYPTNMHAMPQHPYYRKENLQMKGYEYGPHFRNIDPTLGVNSNHLSRFPSQFSPSTIAISPSDSNTSNDTNQTQGTSQEDCGYVSQSSNASVRSMESNFNRMPPEVYRRYEHRYAAMVKASPAMMKLDRSSNSNMSSRGKKDIDVRQFLQMWNEGEDDNGENNSKDATVKIVSSSGENTNRFENANQEQLYVLGLVNVPSEELGKYEHIQKVSKLPENIKGYNSIELLHQFEEVIESSNLNNFNSKPPTPRDFRSSLKGAISMHGKAIPSRPLSPLDVEAKISQSVIHKEVGCNFEIKPCSPKMLNVEVATPVQSVLGERAIEKVSNPLTVHSPGLNAVSDNRDNCNIIKCQDGISVNENAKVTSCKMINTQYSNNDLLDPIKTNYSLQDLESNSGVCLASLPRLDNDIELNFPEVNQQFINANKESVITTASLKDLPPLDIEQPEEINCEVMENKKKGSTQKTKIEKDFSKLSKYRKLKRKSSRPNTPESNVQALRTDSVIIKNPDNCKSYDMNVEKTSSPKNILENLQDNPINLSVNIDHRQNINERGYDINKSNEMQSNEFAIDFSLNSTEQCSLKTNVSEILQSKLEREKPFSALCNSRKPMFDEDVCDFLHDTNEIFHKPILQTKTEASDETDKSHTEENINIQKNEMKSSSTEILKSDNPFRITDNESDIEKIKKCNFVEENLDEISLDSLNTLKDEGNFKTDNAFEDLSTSADKLGMIYHDASIDEKVNILIATQNDFQTLKAAEEMKDLKDSYTAIPNTFDPKESENEMKLEEPKTILLDKKITEFSEELEDVALASPIDKVIFQTQNSSKDNISGKSEAGSDANMCIKAETLLCEEEPHRGEINLSSTKITCPIHKELLSPYIQNLIIHNEGSCATTSENPHNAENSRESEASPTTSDLNDYENDKIHELNLGFSTSEEIVCQTNVDDVVNIQEKKSSIERVDEIKFQEPEINTYTSTGPETLIPENENKASYIDQTTTTFNPSVETEAKTPKTQFIESNRQEHHSEPITACNEEVKVDSRICPQPDADVPVISQEPYVMSVDNNSKDEISLLGKSTLNDISLGEISAKALPNSNVDSTLKYLPDSNKIAPLSINDGSTIESFPDSNKFEPLLDNNDEFPLKIFTGSSDDKCVSEKRLVAYHKNCDESVKTSKSSSKLISLEMRPNLIENEIVIAKISEPEMITTPINIDNEDTCELPTDVATTLEENSDSSDCEPSDKDISTECKLKSPRRNLCEEKLDSEKKDEANYEDLPSVQSNCSSPSMIEMSEDNYDDHLSFDQFDGVLGQPKEITTEDLNSQNTTPSCPASVTESTDNLQNIESNEDSSDKMSDSDIIDDLKQGNTILEAEHKYDHSSTECSELVENVLPDVSNTLNGKRYSNNYLTKKHKSLKRSLSDSALDEIRDNSKDSLDNTTMLWPSKRKKNPEFDDSNEPRYFSENYCNVFQNIRRNSISSIQNEENVSFCILIDNNCIITEECDETQKICFTEVPESCLSCVQEETENVEEDSMAEINSIQDEINLDYSDANFTPDNKSMDEPWVEDVACVETVITDDIAENIVISAATSPKDADLSEADCTDDENEVYNVNEHSDKLKYIYGDKMCSDDTHFVETLYRTPQMNVNKTLINRESQESDDSGRYYDKESLERVLSESNVTEDTECCWNNVDITTPHYLSSPVILKDSPDNKENLRLDSSLTIKTPFDCKELDFDVASDSKQCQEKDMHSKIFNKDIRDNSISSCESSTDNVFTYTKSEESSKCSVSSSPEVSSTTSEEKNSAILLKITNYGGARVSQVNDINIGNRICCKYTEDKDYLSSNNNLPTRTLLTKAAQKYIPPLRETIRDLKVKLPLPQDSLLKLKQLKKAKELLKPNITKPNNVLRKEIPKKPKPKFEDVLKSIDEIQFQMHKEKNKKVKKSIPKVVIKKSENGSHYASTSNKDKFNPDLTGRKWQPWVFLEKNHFIDKMVLKRKTKAIFSHRKNMFVLAEKFRKYKSIGSTKFIMSQPKQNDSSSGQLKYTIRLKHNY